MRDPHFKFPSDADYCGSRTAPNSNVSKHGRKIHFRVISQGASEVGEAWVCNLTGFKEAGIA